MNYKYLLDTNVLLSRVGKKIVNTAFFKESCIVLEEIAYELRDTSLYEEVKKVEVSLSGKMLPHLAIIVDEMVGLGIIKTDEGNGEAMLIAWGLMMKENIDDEPTFEFMKEQPVIVSDETKVIQYAKTKGLEAISGRDFVNSIEAFISLS